MDKILKRLRSAMTDAIINLPAPLVLGFSRLQKAKTTQITTITSYCNLSTFSNLSQCFFFFFGGRLYFQLCTLLASYSSKD